MDPSTNIHFLCRLCGSKTKELQRINMFDSAGVLFEVKSKIMFCLGMNIDEKDNLPQVLCTECVDNVNNYTKFKQNAEKTTNLLQGLFSQQDESVENSQNSCNVEDDSIFDTANYISDPEELIIKPDDSDSLLDQTNISPVVINKRKRQTKRKSSKYSRKRSRKCSKTRKPETDIGNNLVKIDGAKKVNAKKQRKPGKDKFSSYNCDICKKSFKNRKIIYKHMVRHLKKKSILACSFCMKTFSSQTELNIHSKNCNGDLKELKIILQKCEKNVEKDENIENVESVKTNSVMRPRKIVFSSYECDLCKKLYSQKYNIYRHMVRHFTIKPKRKKKIRPTCSYCAKVFRTDDTLNRHIKRKHEIEPKIIICQHCGNTYNDISRFKYHMNTKHCQDLPFECDKCDKKFPVKELLRNHINNMHNENRIQFVCDICGKSLKTKNDLIKHKWRHEKTPEELQALKIYKCLACDKAYDHPCNLKYHMRMHTGETLFECNFCQKKYVRKNGLNVHLLTHTGERNFVCDVCGKAFAISKNLKIHKLIHTGERKFQCNDCDKTYTQNSTLNIHLKKSGHTRKKV